MPRAFRFASLFAIFTLAAALLALTSTSSAAAATVTWTGVYYNNTDFAGPPALVRDDANIDFNWGEGAPGPRVNADNFSVRWTRYYYFNAGGQWTFTLTTDDGARLYLDGCVSQQHDVFGSTRARARRCRYQFQLGRGFPRAQRQRRQFFRTLDALLLL